MCRCVQLDPEELLRWTLAEMGVGGEASLKNYIVDALLIFGNKLKVHSLAIVRCRSVRC